MYLCLFAGHSDMHRHNLGGVRQYTDEGGVRRGGQNATGQAYTDTHLWERERGCSNASLLAITSCAHMHRYIREGGVGGVVLMLAGRSDMHRHSLAGGKAIGGKSAHQ